jgi:leader peptidase (prepilin peptidase)/N-methyltransferase
MEMMITGITGIYLAVMAVIDRRKKEIPILPGVIGMIAIVLAQLLNHTGWRYWLSGVLVGVFLYLTSKLTKGAVGEGDAFVYVLTGTALGFFRNLELLVVSLFLSSLVAGFLLLFRRVGRNYRIPFVPFTALAYGMVMLL